MTDIFRSLPSRGLLATQDELTVDGHKERLTGKDMFDIQDLMIALLKRSSADAMKDLVNDAFADFSHEPDCFLRLLHVLQTHYFSIAHQCVVKNGDRKDPASQFMMNSLLKYVDALMNESLTVLKKLHTGSRQHEEIITWRLNGSFFHTLLPSAIECLSILLQSVPIQSSVAFYASDHFVLVERILPNLDVMLKMLDEVSWKMHSAADTGNQTHDGAVPSYNLTCTDHGYNWFINLGNACAILCGKLCCELLHPMGQEPGDLSQRESYESQVLLEGRFLRESHVSCDASANSISKILEWERMGVFEVEDELVGCERDSGIGNSRLENQLLLLQLCDGDNSSKVVSFWTFVAGKLSPGAEFTTEEKRLMMEVVCVVSWHLDLSLELCSVFKRYDQNATATDLIELPGVISTIVSILIHEGSKISWVYQSLDSEAMENATKASQLLLSLEPNQALVPAILQGDQHKTSTCSLSDMLGFLTKRLDLSNIQCSLDKKEANAALFRVGMCILHDLLRKLTTSSTKSCLLDEFVALTCAVDRSKMPGASKQSFILREIFNQHIDKAVENLFIRLTRIVSSEDASFELKKKALMIWAVPVSATQQSVSSVVDLIVKSGIMNTLVELLLDEANVLDAHSDINVTQLLEARLPTKATPTRALLFGQTPAQVISVLAWEAFSAIAVQLSKSDHFVEHRPNILLRLTGSSFHDREPLTPRNAAMSPRRRLTLPKKTIISSIGEIIEQMVDGLYLMLKGTKDRLNVLDISSHEYEMLVRSVEKSGKTESQVFMFGSPIQASHPSSHDIAAPKSNDVESDTNLALMLWIFAEHASAVASTEAPNEKEPSVRLIAFGSHCSNPTDPINTSRDASFTVFTRDVSPDHVSIGISMKFDGDTNESWRSIFVDEQLPRGKWIQLVFVVHEAGPEHLQIFVGAKQSTLNNGQQSRDPCKSFSLEFLRKAASWTRMSVGGNADVETLSSTPETSRLSVLPKKSPHGFAAVLDDVVITRGDVTDEAIVRMQRNGPVLFRLKQQYIAESHCANILQLLCQLVDSDGSSAGVSPALLPSSDRWISLFTHLLLTSCHDHGLAQVYLCFLLQNLLPRAAPPPGLDVNVLGQNLFGVHQKKTTGVEELFVELNGQSRLSSTSTIRRQNESLYKLMEQDGMLSGKHRGKILPDNGNSSEDTMILKRTASLRCAAAIQLFQTLCNSPLWRGQMDQFIGSARTILQSGETLKSTIQSGENNTIERFQMAAVVNTLAGYSEGVVNSHRAAVQEAAMLPTAGQLCVPPFASVIHLDESNTNQLAAIQSLFTTMLKEETQRSLFLPSRKEILDRFHNDVAAVIAFDCHLGDVIHQRTRILRIVTTFLLREKATVTANRWHHWILGDAAACANLLRIASSNTKECIQSVLGPDAKTAMKLRRLRFFIKKLLGGSKHDHHAPVSVAELESLQWKLWEKTVTGASSTVRIPWWQKSSNNKGKLALEVVGGDVELVDLKVKALEHFPTVRLAQANISANTGLWYFEVVVLTDGLMQIGYIEGDFIADPLQGQGVGDHANSWAFDGFRCKKWNVSSYDYGEQWKIGDVVGVLLDTERMEISYFLNGKCLGVAFSGISITATSRMCPAASLNIQQSAEFNFGSLPTTSSIEEASNITGFKHFPALGNEDQTRLRPIVMALHITDSTAEKEKKNDVSEDWNSSSSDSDTDGKIVLEGSGSLPGFSRDGLESRIVDPKYEENEQRRRDLVEGLTGLGFPLDWATQCATEARLPMDETGAVAWILEQMEKVGLDGRSSRLPGSVSVNDDGAELLSLPVALLRARMQLPNVVTSQSTDGLLGEIPGTEMNFQLPPSAEALGDIRDDEPLNNQISTVSTIYQPSTSLPEHQNAMIINPFIEADRDAQQNDDTTCEAFQPGHYWRKQDNIVSGLDALSDGVDDLLPLRIVVDTTLFVAYTRQILTTLLLMSSRKEEEEAAYEMIRPFLASEESSACLHRFIRIAIGLEATDAAFCIYTKINSGRSLELQKTVAALVRYEARLESCSTDEGSPLLRSLFQEMMSQCERGVNFVRGKTAAKSDSMSAQTSAAWFSWISSVVFGFAEEQVPLSEGIETTRLPDFVNAAISSTSLVEKMVAIASASPSTKAWKYVAFRLIARLLCRLKADESASSFYTSAQLPHLTELLALRLRREMHNRVFFSDVTTALFALLTHSSAAISQDLQREERRYSENQQTNLRVVNYSPTHVMISWDQTPKAGDLVDDVTDSTTVTDSAIVFLHVTRCGSQFPGSQDPVNAAVKALPLKGSYTIRNLLPDTQYLIRVSPSQSAVDSPSAADMLTDANTVQGHQILVQTPLEPVFELDKDSMGKNLVLLNRNLTARNTANKKWHSVRSSVAFEEGVHTWQVRLDTCVSKNIFIGVCTADASMENYIGSDAYGYGFLANKAIWHNKAKLHTYGEIFKQGDIIQVTLDCNAKTLAFSRNGEYLGIAASSMRAGTNRSSVSTANDGNCKWYPAFSMYNKDDKVTLVPPSTTSTFATKDDRSQNASTIEYIEAMQDVLAYQSHLASGSEHLKLFVAAFKEFDGWKRGQILFREVSVGQVIGIDKSKSATDKYGLAYGDSVFTSKGQCNVLGEYQHELWYEIDEAGNPSLFGIPTLQLASWSLSTCRDMVDSPDEYPIHRYHKNKLEVDLENHFITDADSFQELQTAAAISSDDEVFSFNLFVNAQTQWSSNNTNIAEADMRLITDLDATAAAQASNALLLSFADISTTLLLQKNYQVNDNGSNLTLARIGLLLYVNRRLYNVVRLAMPRNPFATSLEMPESHEPKKLYSSRKTSNSEHHQVSPVAALLNSPHWALDDPSAFSWMPSLAARMLFSSQKETLIEEELQQTKTESRTFDTLQGASDTDEVDTDLPVIKVKYPPLRPVPFWECSSPSRQKKKADRLPLLNTSSVFAQLSKQLADQDGRQWRRETSQPFEAIPISQAFQVQIEKPLTDSTGNGKSEKITQQADEDDEDQQLEQPSANQTTNYLKIFENVVREIQSPVFPLFAPVNYPDEVGKGDDQRLLQLDVNLELFSPSALAYSRVQSSQLLLWYFSFGQVMGIAWRSKLLLPLQYISELFWEELVSPASDKRFGSRETAIRAVRDGLFSIVPSRCVALLSGKNPSLRERLSDLDVSYVTRLELHATYSGSHQRHHDLFWSVVKTFTAVERRMLEQFVNPERRDSTKQVEVADNPSSFVLEISDALADGRDHPDSCYPVIVSIGPLSSRLHLPAYSSAQTLRHKLLLAMTNIPFM
ncbi:E3 ubiquitin-protein ligase [Phytophthora citrophthora]|uniref:E3 ubiquitin-protein ligase n=1 Tax=Phytophthora citrophthora TaxID=4793 RepID=A0AAD9GIM8_9STRA|nr:E3 ubiquitin-protein ligase [Phytophthora citrophthora]